MNILDKIVAKRKQRVEELKKLVPESQLNREYEPPAPFFSKKDSVLIAECKKGSPSKGIMLEDYSPLKISQQYFKGGADALSVITEPDFFYGCNDDLKLVRNNSTLPILRKDFIIDPYQIKESWAMGADAILLIASILDKKQLVNLSSMAKDYGLEILLEIHNKEELLIALDIPVNSIGVNARNLKDFSIDLNMSKKLCNMIPKDIIAVAESGMKNPDSVREMYESGFRGFLIGEYFITSKDREATVNEISNLLKNLKVR